MFQQSLQRRLHRTGLLQRPWSLQGFAPARRLALSRPKYDGVLCVPFFKRLPVLCVLRIVHLCHVTLRKYPAAQWIYLLRRPVFEFNACVCCVAKRFVLRRPAPAERHVNAAATAKKRSGLTPEPPFQQGQAQRPRYMRR